MIFNIVFTTNPIILTIKKLPLAENLCMGDIFINDKNYFLVVTLFEADQAP